MVAEVLANLRVQPGGRYVDGTVGGAGHAEAILEMSSPNGWVFGCDRDGVAVEAARRRLARFEGRFEIRRGNFSDLAGWLESEAWDGVLLDLGVSSPQLDTASRGFSFQQDGPLDMRMDDRQETTAADLVNDASVETLANIFWELGGEPDSRRIARAIDQARRARRLATTFQLSQLVESVSPRRGRKIHPATRVFQALRIAVNNELDSLRTGLASAVELLRPEGRLTVITFHSSEDRIVKEFGRRWARDYEIPGNVDVPELRRPVPPKLGIVSRRAIQPTENEVQRNPRSRSAKLRVFEKFSGSAQN